MSEWLQRLPGYRVVRVACLAHGVKGAIVAAALFVVIALATFMLPRKYYSEAKLFVKAGWQNTLDATATTGQTVSFFEPRENEINSILEVLRSRAVMEGVVDALGVDALLHAGPIPEFAAEVANEIAPGKSQRAPATLRDPARQQALAMLEKQILVWIPKRSNTIIVRCEASSPQLAHAINRAYLATYQRVHADVSSTKGSYAFFVEQQRVLREKWEDATAQLRDAKDSLGVSSLVGRRTMLEGQMSDVQKSLLANEADAAATHGRLASLRSNLEATPKFTETTRAENANVAADTMRGNLYTLQMKQKEMLARYTPEHPLARDVNDQVAALEQLLAQEGRIRVQSTSALNPAWSQQESSLLSETARLDSLTAGAKQLQQQQRQLAAQLRQLNDDEIRISQLQQAADVAEKSSLETSQRLEQARMHGQLAQEQITNVNVFQEPSFVSQAIAPKRSLILGLGLLVSMLSGAATIAGCAYLQRSPLSREDLSQRLRLPLIASFSPGLRTAAV